MEVYVPVIARWNRLRQPLWLKTLSQKNHCKVFGLTIVEMLSSFVLRVIRSIIQEESHNRFILKCSMDN